MENNNKNDFNATIGNTGLCDGFLIPMTDFVVKESKTEMKRNELWETQQLKSLKRITNYAKFLKQPLKIEMFVPCDDEGNVLEKPKRDNFLTHGICRTDDFTKSLKEYEKAKEKVLFENPLSSLDMIKDYIRARNTLENFIDMQVSRGRIMKLNKNGMNAIFGTGA